VSPSDLIAAAVAFAVGQIPAVVLIVCQHRERTEAGRLAGDRWRLVPPPKDKTPVPPQEAP
jgi:hypothetical protein